MDGRRMYLGGSHGDMLKEGEEEGVLPRRSSIKGEREGGREGVSE